jgi:hypothetical protein
MGASRIVPAAGAGDCRGQAGDGCLDGMAMVGVDRDGCFTRFDSTVEAGWTEDWSSCRRPVTRNPP